MVTKKKKATKKKASPKKKAVVPPAGGLAAVLGGINKGLEFAAVAEMGSVDCTTTVQRYFCTGVPALDMAFGGPGFAAGRIIEIYGPEAMLKTAIALRVCNSVTKQDGFVFFNDGEAALNEEYVWQERYLRPSATRVDAFGADIWPKGKPRGDTNFFVINPTYVEELRALTFKTIKQFRKAYPVNKKEPLKTVPMMMVFDSVPAMRARDQYHDEELNKKTGDAEQDPRGYPLVAGVLSSWLPELAQVCAREQITCVFINQLRQKLGASMFEDPNVTVGGRALKFYSSYRIYLKTKRMVKRTFKNKATGKTVPQAIGFDISAEFVKNKLNPGDMQKLTIPCYKRVGVCRLWCLKTFFNDLGYIERKGSVSSIRGCGITDTWRGDNQWHGFAKKHWKSLEKYADSIVNSTVDNAFIGEESTDFTHFD